VLNGKRTHCRSANRARKRRPGSGSLPSSGTAARGRTDPACVDRRMPPHTSLRNHPNRRCSLHPPISRASRTKPAGGISQVFVSRKPGPLEVARPFCNTIGLNCQRFDCRWTQLLKRIPDLERASLTRISSFLIWVWLSLIRNDQLLIRGGLPPMRNRPFLIRVSLSLIRNSQTLIWSALPPMRKRSFPIWV